MSGEPQTEAGREWVAGVQMRPAKDMARRLILAIEAEAIAQERGRLAAAVRDIMDGSYGADDTVFRVGQSYMRDAVLALLQGADR